MVSDAIVLYCQCAAGWSSLMFGLGNTQLILLPPALVYTVAGQQHSVLYG